MTDAETPKPATKETPAAGGGKVPEADTLPIDTDQSEVQETFKGYNDNDEFEEFPIFDEKTIDAPEEPQEVNVWEDQ
ncbi:hypothetical protein M3Y99_01447700 [Aphelenchoides fujianensis]|nr:hypothetical protein M3Y99_01447700 [Aphelenchoides fujianensis]